jgi:uncharacterized membrane-anchored protein
MHSCLLTPCVFRVNPKYPKTNVASQQNLQRATMFLSIVAVGWLYVALMMAVAEATSSNGSVLGAIVTFLLYGVGPVGLVIYLMLEPARKRRRKAARLAGMQPPPATSAAPDGGGETSADAVAPVREKT